MTGLTAISFRTLKILTLLSPFFSLSFFCFFCFVSFCFRDGLLLCCPGWSVVAQSQMTAALNSQAQEILLPQSPE